MQRILGPCNHKDLSVFASFLTSEIPRNTKLADFEKDSKPETKTQTRFLYLTEYLASFRTSNVSGIGFRDLPEIGQFRIIQQTQKNISDPSD